MMKKNKKIMFLAGVAILILVVMIIAASRIFNIANVVTGGN
jgi:hypothetical protein